MKKTEKAKINKILFITLSNIGDIVLTLPVLDILAREFPKARIDVMVGPRGEEIFLYDSRTEETIVYEKRSTFLKKISFFLYLRRKKYDLVIDLKNTILPFILCPHYRTRSFGRNVKPGGMHKKEEHLSRLRDFGITDLSGKFNMATGEEDRTNAEKLLSPLRGKPYIVVSPGAKSHVKRWPSDNFAMLCSYLKEETGYEVVFIGDMNDEIIARRILFRMETKPLNLMGKTNIRELAHIIQKSRLLITNDSAPLHIGSAVGVPIVAFFGPTDEKKYGPLTDNASKVLRNKLSCSPCEVAQCYRRGSKRYECLQGISVESARRAACSLLRKDNVKG